MADNVSITAGSGTIIATDEVGGAQYQRVKIALGADGAAADLAPGQGLMAASVPVAIASNQSAVAVSLATAPVLVAGTANIGDVDTQPIAHAMAAGNCHAPAGNTAAIVTIAAAGSGVSNVVNGIAWSYDADPTGGNLKIEDGASTVFTLDITNKGPGFIPFFRKGSTNTALVVTLAAGGVGVTGKVNVLDSWTV